MKKKIDNKVVKTKEIEGRLVYKEPYFNETNKLFEIRKENENGQLLDLIIGSTIEEVIQKKEEEIKAFIMAQIHAKKPSLGLRGGPRPGPRKKSEITHKETKDAIINEMIQRKLEGESVYSIILDMSTNYKLSKPSVGLYLDQALKNIKKRTETMIDDILFTHVNRYEELYKWFLENGFLRHAMRTLKYKEGLLGVGEGLEGRDFGGVFELNLEEKRDYDLRRLSSQEYYTMNSILKKLNLKKKE